MKMEENFSKKKNRSFIYNNIVFESVDNIFTTFIKLYATI